MGWVTVGQWYYEGKIEGAVLSLQIGRAATSFAVGVGEYGVGYEENSWGFDGGSSRQICSWRAEIRQLQWNPNLARRECMVWQQKSERR